MLLEREGLLASLGNQLVEAAKGRGSLILVAGEAGAGKTSLIKEFIAGLDDSTLVIQGACDPLTTPRPLSPLYDFVADGGSGLDGIELDGEPIEIFSGILDRLRHTVRPIVMVVEDVHWADEATLDFLRFLGRRVDESKAVLVCSYHDDEVGPDHPLRSVLGQLIPLATTHRLEVPALTIEAVTRLAGDAGRFDPVELLRLTDGNAFFVSEILASGQDLPETVQEAVVSRVSRLEERPRRVVEGVSVAPRSLSIEDAASIVGGSLEDIDAALAAGVLIGDGHHLRFRHELARSAVEESLPPARRLSLHMRMLSMLEEDASPDLARLVHHALRAGRADLVVEYAPQAGDEAVRRGSRRQAAAFYRSALEHAGELGPDRTAEVRVKLGTELRLLDDPESSVVELSKAIDHFRAVDAPAELADALGLLQGSYWNLRRFEEGWAAIDEAVALLRPLGPTEMLAMTLYRVAHNHMLARHAGPAFEHIAEAREVAEATGSADVGWLALMMTGCIHIVAGEADEGVRVLQQAVTEAKVMENPRFVNIGLGMLGSGAGEARKYDAALPALEEGVEQGSGDRRGLWSRLQPLMAGTCRLRTGPLG